VPGDTGIVGGTLESLDIVAREQVAFVCIVDQHVRKRGGRDRQIGALRGRVEHVADRLVDSGDVVFTTRVDGGPVRLVVDDDERYSKPARAMLLLQIARKVSEDRRVLLHYEDGRYGSADRNAA